MAALTTTVQSTGVNPADGTANSAGTASDGGARSRSWDPERREPRLPAPERYDGSPGECRSFVTQCQLIFHLQPSTFPNDDARVPYVITQLTGRAKKWGKSAWANDRPCIRSSDHFLAELQRVFDRSSSGPEAGRELMRLRQGKVSVSDYAIDFQRLAADGGWEGRPLVDAFIHGLTHEVRDELLAREIPDDGTAHRLGHPHGTPVWRIAVVGGNLAPHHLGANPDLSVWQLDRVVRLTTIPHPGTGASLSLWLWTRPGPAMVSAIDTCAWGPASGAERRVTSQEPVQ